MRNLFETLEDRLVLSAVTVGVDGGATFARAAALGKASGVLTVNNSLSAGEASDFFAFTVRSLGNVNLALAGLSANANLRLFDSVGRQIGISARTRTRAEAISVRLGRGNYVLSVDRGRAAADTAYLLTLQADLNYQTVSIGGSDFAIGIVRADGSTAPIAANLETWVVIHGWLSTPKATHNAAAAIDAASRHNQVLEVDWSSAAADSNVATVALRVAEVGAAVAQKLSDWGIGHLNLNLVGHSLGGYMTDEIARRISGGVDRIVALDPATVSLGGIDFSGTNYAAHSRYSMAFIGSNFSTLSAAQTADETIALDVGRWSSAEAHSAVRDLFAGILEQNNSGRAGPVSPIFSLRALSSARPFLRDGMGSGFEARLVGRSSKGKWVPATVIYKDAVTRGTVTLQA